MATRLAPLIALGVVLATPLACLQDDGGRFNPIRDAMTVSEDEERELGLEFDRQLREHVVVIEDPVVAGFVNDLGQEIVRTIEPQPFVYHFRVIQDPSLNAFAVPGGYIYFHSGTVLSAGSIDELAGVMGHEIAHVKAHHYARMRQKTQIPDLLVGLAGMAAAVATQEPGVLVASQAANVAVKLRFTREFENEADQLGSVFTTRAGYDPTGTTLFFERILHEKSRHPDTIPPYLFSHPDVEDRIATVRQQAENLRATRAPDPRLAKLLPEVQGRLAYLLEEQRQSLPPAAPPDDPHRVDPLLAEADRLAQEGRTDEALIVLARAEALEPRDPRVPFEIGRLLASRGRHRHAVEAYRRTIRLDSSRGRVFYELGLAHKALGERHSAVYAFEQASRRAGSSSPLQQRADWQVETLVFPVLLEVGFADGARGEGETPLGNARPSFSTGAQRLAWWGRLHSRYRNYPDEMQLRWIDPAGHVVAQTDVREFGRSHVGSVLELRAPGITAVGTWRVVVLYQDTAIESWSVPVQSSR